jgi:beta-carotene 15,15'-dioxygenase
MSSKAKTFSPNDVSAPLGFRVSRLMVSGHRQLIVTLMTFVTLLHVFGGDINVLSWPMLSAATILLLGAPHGSLDVAVAGHRRLFTDQRSLVVFLAQYVCLAAAVVAFWWLVPGVALALFLVVSAFHFGGDWQQHVSAPVRLALGGALLSATTIFHSDQVILIFGWLASVQAAEVIAAAMRLAFPFLLLALAPTLWRLLSESWMDLVEILVVIACAIVLPPLTFFLIYFCLLHSVRHLLEVRQELKDQSVTELVRAAAPYALLAAVGCVLGASVFIHLGVGPALVSAVFVALAALTVPHMLLIDGVQHNHGSKGH